jgi:beta-glucan synthesis-associated protein KRE6
MSFPGTMKVDYVRVYQRTDSLSDDALSCSPKNYPTAEYIQNHLDAYTNPNITSWTKQGALGLSAGYPWPKNSAVSDIL